MDKDKRKMNRAIHVIGKIENNNKTVVDLVETFFGWPLDGGLGHTMCGGDDYFEI